VALEKLDCFVSKAILVYVHSRNINIKTSSLLLYKLATSLQQFLSSSKKTKRAFLWSRSADTETLSYKTPELEEGVPTDASLG